MVGSLVGAVSLRLRGDYLAMVTLAFAEIVRNLAISLDRPVNLTGGVNGILNLDVPSIAGFEFREMGAYYYLIWGLALVILAALARLRRSRIGRAWLAIREDEVAAGNMGVSVFGYKLLAFAVVRGPRGNGGERVRGLAGVRLPGELHHPADRHPLRHARGVRRGGDAGHRGRRGGAHDPAGMAAGLRRLPDAAASARSSSW